MHTDLLVMACDHFDLIRPFVAMMKKLETRAVRMFFPVRNESAGERENIQYKKLDDFFCSFAAVDDTVDKNDSTNFEGKKSNQSWKNIHEMNGSI